MGSTKNKNFASKFGLIFAFLLLASSAKAEVEAVYLSPHFHYDPIFVEDQNTYTDIGIDRCRRYLKCIKEDPGCAAVFSEIDYLKPFYDTFPEEREDVRKFIAENRLELGGSYNEPNEMSVGGEGLIRNILYGRAYHEKVLGDKHDLVYMPFDVFGHTIQLSQILKKSRYIGIIWRKGNPAIPSTGGTTVPGLPQDFIGLSPDGSTLHHRREHYKSYYAGSESDLLGKVNKRIKYQNTLGLPYDFGLLSRDDFSYPEPWIIGKTETLKQNKPPIYISGPSAYFYAMDKKLKENKAWMPMVSRDFSLYHTGTALTRVDLKIGYRLTENMLLDSEKFSVFASMFGARYPFADLDFAWRQLLFNQHHDGITGTCCDKCFFDMMAGYKESYALASSAVYDAAVSIASSVKTPDFVTKKNYIPIVVFNPIGWKRTDVVKIDLSTMLNEGVKADISIFDANEKDVAASIATDSSGKPVQATFVAIDVPSIGYKTYYLAVTDSKAGNTEKMKETTGKYEIENEFYSLTVDPARGGSIVELLDKKTGRKVIDDKTKYTGNELIVLKEDKGGEYPAWELTTTRTAAKSADYKAEVVVEKKAPVSRLIVKGDIPELGKYQQEIVLTEGVKRIDFITKILSPAVSEDPSDRNFWLVRFPVKMNGTGPIVEDRFFAASRRESLMPLNYRTDLDQMLTQSAPYSALNWVEEGTAVRLDVNDESGKTVKGIAIGLCEIVHTRSADSIAAAYELEKALITRGVTCTPSFADEDRNKDLLNRNFRFVLDINGDNDFVKAAIGNDGVEKSFKEKVSKDGTAELMVRVKANDVIIRKVDTLIIGGSDAGQLKKRIADIAEVVRDKARLTIDENADKTGIKGNPPDDYGIALINRGNLLHSFDSNGTVVMGLFHSVQWARTLAGFPYSMTEDKNHIYSYSLYPHGNDWREAKTYRVGMEVNNPLIAVIKKGNNESFLPIENSFIDVDSNGIVISAIKVAGNPYASMNTNGGDGITEGVILRFYEAEGSPETFKAKLYGKVKSVRNVNLIEEPDGRNEVKLVDGNTLEMNVGPNSIETLLIEYETDEHYVKQKNNEVVTEEPESSYWKLNAGAAYEMNSPVSITIGYPPEKIAPVTGMKSFDIQKKKKDVKKGKNKLRLVVSNNSMVSKLKGNVTINAPGNVVLDRSELQVELDPGQGEVYELTAEAEQAPKGYIEAVMKTKEGVYRASMPVGKHEDLVVTASVQKNEEKSGKISVKLHNNQEGKIEGMIIPVGPAESFFESNLGLYSTNSDFKEIETGKPVKYSLETGKDFTVDIPYDGNFSPLPLNSWIMLKITYNDAVKYLPVKIEG